MGARVETAIDCLAFRQLGDVSRDATAPAFILTALRQTSAGRDDDV
jgi:hypothetical protein